MKSHLALITLAIISLNAHAALHKWVDADGVVHYSDTVPPDVSTQTVRDVAGKGKTDTPPSYTPKSYVERDAELKKAKQEKEEAEKKKAQQDEAAETKKRNCEAARQNVRLLEEGTRIVTYDANGERSYLDDNARAQRLEEARKAVSANCN
jgi:hypothetical protein